MNLQIDGINALQVGSTRIVEISDVAFGGEGVARLDDFAIFVPFVFTGEAVKVELTEIKKRFGRARLLEVLRPAAERVTPRCPYFGVCGGCQYQHVDYAAQLKLKHKQVIDIFQRVGHFRDPPVEAVAPSPQQYGYRNRIMVRSQWDKFKKGLNIGFVRADSRLVVDIEECKIAEPVLNGQLAEVRQHPPPKGGIKVILRQLPSGWQVPPDSFFQNNFYLMPKLVEEVRERLRHAHARFLVDAYCGVGFFCLELADLVQRWAGVEIDARAIKAARVNAATRQRSNGEFFEGRTEDLLPELLERFHPAETALLVDPPRTGCSTPSLELMRRVQPAQILYVSCHPATLARDLNILCHDQVYQLVKVIPLDMFPQTQHVECIADLRLASRLPTSPPV